MQTHEAEHWLLPGNFPTGIKVPGFGTDHGWVQKVMTCLAVS